MKFYKFDQNNSGGSFDVNEQLCHRVVIEANTEEEAIEIGENMGIYFDGCSMGIDCSCCGDRWYNPDEVILPIQYGEITFDNIEDYMQYLANHYGWTSPDIRIFYNDGSMKEIYKK